jgi:hypothetical protein
VGAGGAFPRSKKHATREERQYGGKGTPALESDKIHNFVGVVHEPTFEPKMTSFLPTPLPFPQHGFLH